MVSQTQKNSILYEPNSYMLPSFLHGVPYLAKLNQVNKCIYRNRLVPRHHQHKPSRQVAGRDRLLQ